MVKCISRRLWPVLGSGAIGVAACSFFVDPAASQCETTAECEGRGAGFVGTACVDGYCRPVAGPEAGTGGAPNVSGGGGSGGSGGTGVMGAGGSGATGGGGSGGLGPGGAAGAAGGGGAGPPPLPEIWSCLESNPPPPTVPPEVTIAIDFEAYGSGLPDAGLELTVCKRLDPGCLQPLGTTVSDEAGRAVFTVPTGGNGSGGPKGFAGYVEVRSADDSLMPMLVFFNPDIVADEVVKPYLDLTTFKRAEFETLVQVVAGAFDPARGHVVVAAQRCEVGAAAPGVHYEVDQSAEGTAAFYMASGLPTTTAKKTDVSGIGGFVQAPIAFLTITGSVWDDAYGGPIAEVARLQVQTRPGWVTVTRLAPPLRPAPVAGRAVSAPGGGAP
jgi:hypothetical protein